MTYLVTRKPADSRLRLVLAAILLAIAGLLALVPTRASAGDLAAWQVVGYSADARHYAFAEYGRQDGSGFPYAALYIIDLDEDDYVGDAPFRTLIEDETASVGAALAQVHEAAAGDLAAFAISQPGRFMAVDPPTEADEDRRAISFFPVPGVAPSGTADTLSLTTVDLPDQPMCDQMGDTYGFALALNGSEVYRDTSIPKSRSCPLDYQVAAIVMPMEPPFDRAVAMISVLQVGFEGPSRRLIAVPFPL